MKLITSIAQTYAQIAVSKSVGVIAFSNDGKIYVKKYDGVIVENLYEFNATPDAIALSPSATFCAYTVSDQTFVRQLSTGTETAHDAAGNIAVNDNGDLLATDPIYFNAPLEVTMNGTLKCAFTNNGYVFASERELYNGTLRTTHETILGVFRDFYVTDAGFLRTYSGIMIQNTGLAVTQTFDFGNYVGLYADKLYVVNTKNFRESVETVPVLEVRPAILKVATVVETKGTELGAFYVDQKRAGRPTFTNGVYLHLDCTANRLYIGPARITTDAGSLEKYYAFLEGFTTIRIGENLYEITTQVYGNGLYIEGITAEAGPNTITFGNESLDGDGFIWQQYRFEDNAAYDEVTEAEITLSGTANITGGKLYTNPTAYLNYALFNPVVFGEGENFCIKLKLNMPFANDRSANTILSVYSSLSNANTSWYMSRIGNESGRPAGKLAFNIKTSNTVYFQITSTTTLLANVDYAVEVNRTDGVLYLFVNGVLEATAPFNDAFFGTNPISMRTDVLDNLNQNVTTRLGGGIKWDIQISRGGKYATSNYAVTPLPKYERPMYTEEEISAIVLQMGFRRGSAFCEKNDSPWAVSGTATVTKNARSNQTNATTSWAQVSMPYFGAGDFTIEFTCIMSALNSSFGIGMGNYAATGSSSENNKWYLSISLSLAVGFGMFSTTSAFSGMATSTGVFTLGKENHIVVERVSGVTSIYVNRALVAQSSNLNFPMRGSNGLFSTTALNRANSFAGSIWNVRIADKAMYNGKVKTLPAFPGFSVVQPTRANLVSLYRFNGNNSGEGSNALALSSIGTITYDNESPIAGRQSAVFNGSSGFFNAAGPLIGTGPFTIGCWIRPTVAATGQLIQMRSAQNNGQFVFYFASNRALAYYDGATSGQGTGGTAIATTNTELIPLNTWTHVAMSRDATNMLRLYINGQVRFAQQFANPVSLLSTNGLSIGYDQRSNSQYFQGRMAEPFIIGRQLTNRELRWLAESKLPFPS